MTVNRGASRTVDGGRCEADGYSSQRVKKPIPAVPFERLKPRATVALKRTTQHPTPASQNPRRGKSTPPAIRGDSQAIASRTSPVSEMNSSGCHHRTRTEYAIKQAAAKRPHQARPS